MNKPRMNCCATDFSGLSSAKNGAQAQRCARQRFQSREEGVIMKAFGMMRTITTATLALLLAGAACAQTLRIGLAEDPDVLDPTLARTFVGRIVFAALCDKLVAIDDKLNIVPQLATSWQWSPDDKSLTMKFRPRATFHDGEKFDAAAVKYNLERHKTMAGSNRRGELAPVTSVDVVDASTVRLNLNAPFAPLLAQLADRAG